MDVSVFTKSHTHLCLVNVRQNIIQYYYCSLAIELGFIKKHHHYCSILELALVSLYNSVSSWVESCIADCILLVFFGFRFLEQFYGVNIQSAAGLFFCIVHICRVLIC